MEQIYKTIAAAIMEKAVNINYFALRVDGEGWYFASAMVVSRSNGRIDGIMPLWWSCDAEGFRLDELIDYLKNYDRHDTCDNQNNSVLEREAE